MGLFGKKKEEVTPESLGFGFPASERRDSLDLELPDAPESESNFNELPPAPMPKQAPSQMMQQQPMMAQQQRPAPVPIPVMAQSMQARQDLPTLEERPVMPMTMPEDIQGPRAPPIQRLRPHVFLKISKYKEVMTSIDRVMNYIKDLKRSLKGIQEVEEKELIKIKESDDLLMRLEEIAGVFDKIFSNPEK
ncbi:MAG TPA: hypothetical protein VI790_03610 [Candidatus Nanoarchaeia archaeon]|nr:hypothetical protein [Candidatus Nanoarchaeia archaeon]